MNGKPTRLNLRRTVVVMLLVVGPCAATVTGCGAFGRTTPHAAGEVVHVPPPRVEVSVPHVDGAEVDQAVVAARRDDMLSPIDGMSSADREVAQEIA